MLSRTSTPPLQSFAWLARSKHLFRTMNESRYLFVQLRLMELRNRFLIKRRPLKQDKA